MINLKSLLGGFPEIIQYVIVIGIILVLLYVSLLVTRYIGKRSGSDKIYFDDPEAYDKTIPDLFASTALKRKRKSASSSKNDAKDTSDLKDEEK